MLTAIVFLLILSVLVLIHEAGHYFVAKFLGIKVEEFGFGLPLTKAIFSIKRGETTYSFYPALIGGFVKLYGEDEAGAGRIKVAGEKKHVKEKGDEHRAYYSRSILQRFTVVVAGVVMNALLAVVIFYTFLFISGFKTELPLIGKHNFFAVNQLVKTEVIVNEVAKNSPASKAGIKPFSRVTAINNKPQKSVDEFVETIRQNKGKEITIEWMDIQSGKKYKATLVPRTDPPKNEGALGVSFFPIETVTLSYDTPTQKLFSGFTHPTNLMAYNFTVLGNLIKVSIDNKDAAPISEGVSGPVGIYSVVGTIVNIPDFKERILQILNLAGLLSISLAFFNVLPIPGLDGGRLFFIVVEAVTGRKVNQKFEAYAHAVGMAFLILLIVLITFKDISQLFR